MDDLITAHIETPIGDMVACATADALCMLEFEDRDRLDQHFVRLRQQTGASILPGRNRIIDQTTSEVTEYFSGKRQEFSIPLLLMGSSFQQSVWKLLCEIPFGQTRSYLDLARWLGEPQAVRAVARANGQNWIAVVVPCHRVIGSDGSLTGYAGGLRRKRHLLELENADALVPPGQERLF